MRQNQKLNESLKGLNQKGLTIALSHSLPREAREKIQIALENVINKGK